MPPDASNFYHHPRRVQKCFEIYVSKRHSIAKRGCSILVQIPIFIYTSLFRGEKYKNFIIFLTNIRVVCGEQIIFTQFSESFTNVSTLEFLCEICCVFYTNFLSPVTKYFVSQRGLLKNCRTINSAGKIAPANPLESDMHFAPPVLRRAPALL